MSFSKHARRRLGTAPHVADVVDGVLAAGERRHVLGVEGAARRRDLRDPSHGEGSGQRAPHR